MTVSKDYKALALAYNRELKETLQTVYEALNKGQKAKLLKDKKVRALFDKYHVSVD